MKIRPFNIDKNRLKGTKPICIIELDEKFMIKDRFFYVYGIKTDQSAFIKSFDGQKYSTTYLKNLPDLIHEDFYFHFLRENNYQVALNKCLEGTQRKKFPYIVAFLFKDNLYSF